MKLSLSFKAEDFRILREFEYAVHNQLGEFVHVGTNSLCVYLFFPREFSDVFHSAPDSYECELSSLLPQGNVKVSFINKDFKSRRDFDNGVSRQMDKTATVLSSEFGWCVAYYFDYPKELTAMLQPFPKETKLDFELESVKLVTPYLS